MPALGKCGAEAKSVITELFPLLYVKQSRSAGRQKKAQRFIAGKAKEESRFRSAEGSRAGRRMKRTKKSHPRDPRLLCFLPAEACSERSRRVVNSNPKSIAKNIITVTANIWKRRPSPRNGKRALRSPKTRTVRRGRMSTSNTSAAAVSSIGTQKNRQKKQRWVRRVLRIQRDCNADPGTDSKRRIRAAAGA